MDHPYVQHLIRQASTSNARIAIPDAQFDARFLEAAHIVHNKGWLNVVLAGDRKQIEVLAKQKNFDITGIEIIDPDECAQFDLFCDEYAQLRAKEGLTSQQIRDLLHEPVYFACMLHRHGIVDGICSGVHYSTANLARAAIKILGMQKGFSKMTALAVVLFKHTALGDNLVYACADGTILPRPTSEELADIAILSADKAKVILPDKPRVAMLSFSTQGSAKHEEVDRVVKALEIVRLRRPDICIDGEFQIDAALSPYVASMKVKRPSEVAGRANVLIWPDLQAGNMAGKGMMLMASGQLAGACFLGINGVVNDHSRGATVEECVINIAFVGAQIQK
ncbi:MAG: phosphate acyltransferase [Sedimentisphaerales bacterium]|nr:phosphate acyltransferase [Sedimentisphaerales bacterium]